jgi:hypothetical protein
VDVLIGYDVVYYLQMTSEALVLQIVNTMRATLSAGDWGLAVVTRRHENSLVR